MVLKWPKALGTALLETAIIPNTSNIRLIRKRFFIKKDNYDDQVRTIKNLFKINNILVLE